MRVPTPPRPRPASLPPGCLTRGPATRSCAPRTNTAVTKAKNTQAVVAISTLSVKACPAKAMKASRMITRSVRRNRLVWCATQRTNRTTSRPRPTRPPSTRTRRYSLWAAEVWISRARSLSGGMMALPAPTPQPNQGEVAAACSNAGHSRSRPLRLPASLLSTLNSRIEERSVARATSKGNRQAASSRGRTRRWRGNAGERTKIRVSPVTATA